MKRAFLVTTLIIVAVAAGFVVMFRHPSAARQPASGVWMTGMDAALAEAAKLKRPVLVDFTGSDWCPWCMKLHKEVFSQEAFLAYARDNLVLMMADFPRRTALPEDLVKQNEALAQKYAVQGFPTVLILDAKGNVLGRLGYKPGGAEAFVQLIRQVLASPAPKAAGVP